MSKVVLITGGSSGIGKSVGEYLQTKGFKVYGTSRNPDNYPDSKFPIVALDVTKPETISKCIFDILTLEPKIDVLLNPRNCKGVKYSSFFSSEISGIPPIQQENPLSFNS